MALEDEDLQPRTVKSKPKDLEPLSIEALELYIGELEAEIADGVEFWGAEEEGRLLGVMGIQDRGEVALVRHAYVASGAQRKGVGQKLLRHVQGLVRKPLLVGTWAAAEWAIAFYRRNGFVLVPPTQKDSLLRKSWSIPERQIETSVVLASRNPEPNRVEEP